MDFFWPSSGTEQHIDPEVTRSQRKFLAQSVGAKNLLPDASDSFHTSENSTERPPRRVFFRRRFVSGHTAEDVQKAAVFWLSWPVAMDNRHRAVFAYMGLRLLKRKNKNRRYWGHPVMSCHLLQVTFCALLNQLQEDKYKFFNDFRMSFTSFDELYYSVENILKK
ncbi:hypothetical protein PR048_010334 [Dryococelus australis]|uniref:Uncharacterized protein n=1 Tax=Dryococelus australis TaxID=614101 RepID=A0ABQ9I2F7_9NEOP|nr:hypothetical protein PR048_010334 [Dryococelus australis]